MVVGFEFLPRFVMGSFQRCKPLVNYRGQFSLQCRLVHGEIDCFAEFCGQQCHKYIFLRKFKSFSVELGSRAMKGWGLYLVTICKLFQRLVKENANYIDSIAPNLVFFFFLISEATLVTSFGAIQLNLEVIDSTFWLKNCEI